MTMCAENTMATKQLVPFSPLDEFDIADIAVWATWVLAMRGGRGGATRGGIRGELRILLIRELGSWSFFDHSMCVLARIISSPKIMVQPPFKY